MRSFVPGALQLPSKALTTLLTRIKSAVSERTKSNVVLRDLFWSIVEDLTKGSTLVEVGCSIHSEDLSPRIVKFYFIICKHFYERFLWKHKDTSVQIKVARKRAKILYYRPVLEICGG